MSLDIKIHDAGQSARGATGFRITTHSTWCVIGNRSMGLSVSAIVCDWLHPTGETAL